MTWLAAVIVMTAGILAPVHLDEIPADSCTALWLDTEVLDTEWRTKYGTAPPSCWLAQVGQKPRPCDSLKWPVHSNES